MMMMIIVVIIAIINFVVVPLLPGAGLDTYRALTVQRSLCAWGRCMLS